MKVIVNLIIYFLLNIFTCEAQGIKIGSQLWMTKNLEVTKFKNGDLILEVTNDNEWKTALESQTPAFCYYNYDRSNNKYGKLYNWYAVIDYRGLAPEGWKIPSNKDFEELVIYLGRNGGTDLKSIEWLIKIYSTLEYIKPVNPGFNALPSGIRSPKNYFAGINESAVWWTNSQKDYFHAYILSLLSQNGGFVSCCDKLGLSGGATVRCIKE